MVIEYKHSEQQQLFYSNPPGMRWRFGYEENKRWSKWVLGANDEPAWALEATYEVELIPNPMYYQQRLEVPAPEMVAPSAGTKYYSCSVGVRRYVWSDCRYDRRLLREGLVYLTEVKAAERYQAWLKLEEE